MLFSNLLLVAVHGAFSPWAAASTAPNVRTAPRDHEPSVAWQTGAPSRRDQIFRLTLETPPLPVPPRLIIGSSPYDFSPLPQPWVNLPTRSPFDRFPAADPFEIFGQIIDAEDKPGPLGTVTSARFHFPTDAGSKHRLVPFLSVLQDIDEIDAHERDGIGAGLSYYFNSRDHVDLEYEFLDAASKHNPALSSENRVTLIFSRKF